MKSQSFTIKDATKDKPKQGRKDAPVPTYPEPQGDPSY